jgi:hypothetical protein
MITLCTQDRRIWTDTHDMRGSSPMTSESDRADAFAAVAALLWDEREALEQLLFKLVEEQLILVSGSTRWLNRADAEVRTAVTSLRASEVLRAAEVDALARRLELPAETTLVELAEKAPEPWPLVLSEHRGALRGLVLEIDAVAAENRRLLVASAHAVSETLAGLHLSPENYEALGSTEPAYPRPYLLDE